MLPDFCKAKITVFREAPVLQMLILPSALGGGTVIERFLFSNTPYLAPHR